jgi:hypothetical protein
MEGQVWLVLHSGYSLVCLILTSIWLELTNGGGGMLSYSVNWGIAVHTATQWLPSRGLRELIGLRDSSTVSVLWSWGVLGGKTGAGSLDPMLG